jgi:hypothetical protein
VNIRRFSLLLALPVITTIAVADSTYNNAFAAPVTQPFAADFQAGPAAATQAGLVCQATASKSIPQPSQEQLNAAGLGGVQLAPDMARRDRVAPPFSRSTSITNPLFPISKLRSAILNGVVDGQVFHTETTLLPITQIVEWTPGQCVRVLVSQYMAFLGGRLEETAIDWYAQANDGSVWYLGESVFDYNEAGQIFTTEGTWHAGIEGPAAMIMPAAPQIGDAFRPENIPGNVFEEVIVTNVGQTFDGPSGRVSGVIVGNETHQDGSISEKVFAPGYGEFRSTTGNNIEAMALASPIDFVPGGVPQDLSNISAGADRIFGSRLRTQTEWNQARLLAREIQKDWANVRAAGVPPRLVEPIDVAVRDLIAKIASGNVAGTYEASIAVAYAGNDLELRYKPVTKVDTVRFKLWARRALVDATSNTIDDVRSDVVTLEWIRDRIAHTFSPVKLTRLDTLVRDLGRAVVDNDAATAAELARGILALINGIH